MIGTKLSSTACSHASGEPNDTVQGSTTPVPDGIVGVPGASLARSGQVRVGPGLFVGRNFAVHRVAVLLDWPGHGDGFVAGDQGLDGGQSGPGRRKAQRRLVARLALPDLGNPENVFIGGIFGHDEAEAAWDGVGVVAAQHVDQLGAASQGGGQFDDETVHEAPRKDQDTRIARGWPSGSTAYREWWRRR